MIKRILLTKNLFFLSIFLTALAFASNAAADVATDLLPGIYLQDSSGDITVSAWSVPLVFDWNNDGKKDLLIGENSGGTNGYVKYYENIGTDARPLFGSPVYIQACSPLCSNLWGQGEG